jgi:Ca-activated chloride channel family protein
VLTDVSVSGTAVEQCAPARPPDVFAGAPSLLSVSLRPEGGELVVRARTASGDFERRLAVPPAMPGEANAALAKLYGRERVEDLELQIAAGFDQADINQQIERAGLELQISTRLTSWVAVSKERTVDPGAPTRREDIPVELPHGMSVEGLGLRRAGMTPMQGQAARAPAAKAMAGPMGAPAESTRRRTEQKKEVQDLGESPPPAESAFDDAFDSEFESEPTTGASLPALPEPVQEEAPAPDAVDRLERAKAPKKAPARAPAPMAPAPTTLEKPKDAPAHGVAKGGAKADRAQGKRLAGRIILRRGRELVLEVLIGGGGLSWKLPVSVEVRLRDGSAAPAAVKAEGSTRDGAYPDGVWVRVVVELSFEGGDPAEVWMVVGGEPVVVVVQG